MRYTFLMRPEYSGRKSRVFEPSSTEPFRISRSKIDLFLECPRCFYLGQRLGVKRPSTAPFTLNNAVDHLLKKEFDSHRAKGDAHPLMKKYGIDAVPFKHKDMDRWRHNFSGVDTLHAPTNFLVFGAVDDIWENARGELHVVDYKATSKDEEVSELNDSRWHDQYRRQMEVYQWLLRQNKFRVSDTGYFVYVNAYRDRKAFDGKLEFDVRVIAYKGSDRWVPSVLEKANKCLLSKRIPETGEACEYCPYREAAGRAFKAAILKNGGKTCIGESGTIKKDETGTPTSARLF
ncbi:MAG: hypothetical protein A2W52_04725 [Candidatus Taylorbacteria bacterium RIFCSPHIGHO2_02_49_25]|uniref:PD-(D/E)XK endonuclease-like domain-containing protein n=1 Tax=Candidatus Taylorbacteria bacterium RIFCSPHIGHO2_02_49_25 TaxID=1802305 RepID=A0A1G2MJI5_9BACT|nr:MAG: hypothetical protein A2759_04390 [Candidatus Taylorbacteria bacterium RIFCSPHIGHO2_01_FULL_49_60]OHA23181.1 MAG: hypothetical protein A2W52_04725 [Candidatus Taylorbacteria bacterium RIFCSPHIGHO2_02_49_25]OHA36881.1 MAG: hypothetical protein A2W65_03850 [Candidatus Taylorbacteria bacterium RIFCSPLOWO2_02_50_13]OHA40687.1 MAG: hypothetical protein A3H73_03600 [Candidatus Taylorbacteria bacterium RIFCSPLOWO2_02_FULL_50_120]OHA47148.1 MAG: hypothetical protein A3G61_01275 [Candidatus Taylo